jgi:hypothetical protein
LSKLTAGKLEKQRSGYPATLESNTPLLYIENWAGFVGTGFVSFSPL